MRLWDVDAGTCTAVLNGHMDWVRCLEDLGGGRLLSGSMDGSLRVWNTATGACLAVMPNAHGEDEGGVHFAASWALPGGAVTGSREGTVQRWRWNGGTRNAVTPDGAPLQLEGGPVRSLAAGPEPEGPQKLLAGCHNNGIVRVLGTDADGALRLQAALAGHSAGVRAMAVMAS